MREVRVQRPYQISQRMLYLVEGVHTGKMNSWSLGHTLHQMHQIQGSYRSLNAFKLLEFLTPPWNALKPPRIMKIIPKLLEFSLNFSKKKPSKSSLKFANNGTFLVVIKFCESLTTQGFGEKNPYIPEKTWFLLENILEFCFCEIGGSPALR